MYPPDWPTCACGEPVLDGHLTCGRVECDEVKARLIREHFEWLYCRHLLTLDEDALREFAKRARV